jgi:Bacterial TSP3 repeat
MYPVSPWCGTLTGVRIGILILGVVLLTSSHAAAQDDDCGLPCEALVSASNSPRLSPPGDEIIIGDTTEPVSGIAELKEPVYVYPGTADTGIAELSEPVYAYPGPADTLDLDSDGDGLFDRDEVNAFFTDPYNWDTDGDGVGDGEEVYLGTDPLT